LIPRLDGVILWLEWKEAVAEPSLDKAVLQDVLSKKVSRPALIMAADTISGCICTAWHSGTHPTRWTASLGKPR